MNVMEGARVVELLTKHFDKDTAKYLDGWDDAKIAEACKVPAESVSRVRVNNFGRLISKAGARPEISREEFETLKQAVALLQGTLYDLCSILGHVPRMP